MRPLIALAFTSLVVSGCTQTDSDRVLAADQALQLDNPGKWTVTPDVGTQRVFSARERFVDICGKAFVDRHGVTSSNHPPRVERFIITTTTSGRYVSQMYDGVDDPEFVSSFQESWGRLCPGYALGREGMGEK